VGSLLVREAMRQSSVYGVQGASQTGVGGSFILKSTVVNTPARSLLHSISWSGASLHNESRAWSPFVHHMSTSAAQKTEEEPKNTVARTKEERFEKPTEISSYWGVVPKVQFKEDGTPWKWTCFTVRI